MILIVTATPWEASALEKALPAVTGRSRQPVKLVRCGVGKDKVAATLDDLKPSLVLSCGFAGAVQQDLSTGDLVADVRGLETELALAVREAASDTDVPLALGPVGQADKVLSAQDKRRLAADPAARIAAVDMETAAVRRWCAERDVPCLALRSVLDEQGDDLPDTWPESDGLGASLSYLRTNWRRLPLLLSVWRKSARAGRSLRRALPALLEKI